MMSAAEIDRHNEEVRTVWDAYRKRQPVRVPVTIGTATRYFLLGEKAPFANVDFKAYIENPDVMFETQVRIKDWLRHNVVQDAAMGLPSEEEGWAIAVDFQNFY